MDKAKTKTIIATVLLVAGLGLLAMAGNYYTVMKDYENTLNMSMAKAEEATNAGNLEEAQKYADYMTTDLADYESNRGSMLAFGGGGVLSLIVGGVVFARRKKV